MSTIVAAGAGNWSSTTPNAPWPSGTVPGNGDVADCAGFDVALDIATVPATGTLLEMKSSGAGGFTLNIAAAAFSGGGTINVTTMTSGTKTTGLLNVSGAGAGRTVTVNVTTPVVGASGKYVVYSGATAGTVAIVGVVNTAQAYYLFMNLSSGGMSFNTCNIVGGSVAAMSGVRAYGTGPIAITNCTITGGTVGRCCREVEESYSITVVGKLSAGGCQNMEDG